MKPLRRPRLWLVSWCGAIALVVLFSLLPAPDLPDVPPGGDKLEHFAAYCFLAAGAVQLFATRRALLGVGLGLIGLGAGLEVAQSLFTSTRMMDAADAIANGIGVCIGLATALTPWRDALLGFDRRH